MSHPLALPPLEGTSASSANSPANSSTSPSSSKSLTLACDYLSFGCTKTFANESDLEAHLSASSSLQRHLLQVQNAYVDLHKRFDAEKEDIEASRAKLSEEQAAHAEDIERSRMEVERLKSSLSAVRITASENASKLEQEQAQNAELKKLFDGQKSKLAQAAQEVESLTESQRTSSVRIAELQTSLRDREAALQTAQANSPPPATTTPSSGGGMSLDEQAEMQGILSTLRHEVTQLRSQLHAVHMNQVPQEATSSADQELLARTQKELADAQQSLHFRTKQVDELQSQSTVVSKLHEGSVLEYSRKISQLESALATSQTALQDAETKLVAMGVPVEEGANRNIRIRTGSSVSNSPAITSTPRTLVAPVAYTPSSDEPLPTNVSELQNLLQFERAEFAAFREGVEKERAVWMAQKKAMEIKLMKIESFSPMSPHHSANIAAEQAEEALSSPLGGGPSSSVPPNATSQSIVPRHPAHSPTASGRTSPRTSALQSQQQMDHPSHPPKRLSIGGGVAGNALMSLSEKRSILCDKISAFENQKQQLAAKLDSYLGSEILYFEVKIERGVNCSASKPADRVNLPPVNGSSNNNNPAVAAGGASMNIGSNWTVAPPSPSRNIQNNNNNSDSNKSAVFIGIGLRDETILTSNPSSQHSIGASSLPGHHAGSFSYCSLNGRIYDGRSKAPRSPAPGQPATNPIIVGGEFVYGPPYGRGDVIGVGWNVSARQLFFTKNGLHLGIAAYEIELAAYTATVGIVSDHGGEELSFNFGERPFLWRGLPLRDENLSLTSQRFLYTTPPCLGIGLDTLGVSSPYLELKALRGVALGVAQKHLLTTLPSPNATSGGSAEVQVSEIEEEKLVEQDLDDIETTDQPPSSPAPTATSSSSSSSSSALSDFISSLLSNSLLTCVLNLPPRDTDEVTAVTSFNPNHPNVTPLRSARGEAMAVCFAKQTLLPVCELCITLEGVHNFLRADYPNIGWISLHAYVKDSALANFKLAASTERMPVGDARIVRESPEGVLSLPVSLVHQSHPARHLMIVVQGVDVHTKNQTMLAVSDDIMDLSMLVESKSSSSSDSTAVTSISSSSRGGVGQFVTPPGVMQCNLSKDGRILKNCSAIVQLTRITGGKPAFLRAVNAFASSSNSTALVVPPPTSVQQPRRSLSSASSGESSPTSSSSSYSPPLSRSQTGVLQPEQLQIDSIYQQGYSPSPTPSPIASMHSRSLTPMWEGATASFSGSHHAPGGVELSNPSTPAASGRRFVYPDMADGNHNAAAMAAVGPPPSPLRPYPPQRQISSSPPHHSRNGSLSSAASASPPIGMARTLSGNQQQQQAYMYSPNAPGAVAGSSSAIVPAPLPPPSLMDADELELAPLTKKLSRLYHDQRRISSRLAHLREEVASYLEEEQSSLFAPVGGGSGASSREQTLAQLALMKRNVLSGLPQLSGLNSLSANSTNSASVSHSPPSPRSAYSPSHSASPLHSQVGGFDASVINSAKGISVNLRKAIVGVGPQAEAELDQLIAAGGGAYSTLFHLHILSQSMSASSSHKFHSVKQLIPFVQKQHARMMQSYVERMKKREEEIDSKCLFQ